MTTSIAAVHVSLEVISVTSPPISVEQFHKRGVAFTEALMDQEEACDDITDMSLAGDASGMTWTVEMLVRTGDEFHALMRAATVIRAALHSLGDSTPGWPTVDQVREVFRPAGLQTELTHVPAA